MFTINYTEKHQTRDIASQDQDLQKKNSKIGLTDKSTVPSCWPLLKRSIAKIELLMANWKYVDV